jgi:hypothetical protein
MPARAAAAWWAFESHAFRRSAACAAHDSGLNAPNHLREGSQHPTSNLLLANAADAHAPASSRDKSRVWKVASNHCCLIAGRAPPPAMGDAPRVFPRETAMGSLTAYVSGADPLNYQPANITFDLLPKLENPPRDKKVRYAEVCRRALAALEEYLCAHV